jgi:hypothetical protein
MRPACFQANPKFSQIQPNPPKPQQRKSKEKAWISLDSLVGIEPFQWFAPTPPPGAKRILLVSWVAEAFALEATPSARSIVQSTFVPATLENRNQVTINPDFLQSIVFFA